MISGAWAKPPQPSNAREGIRRAQGDGPKVERRGPLRRGNGGVEVEAVAQCPKWSIDSIAEVYSECISCIIFNMYSDVFIEFIGRDYSFFGGYWCIELLA
jgi:hypothetical protein